MPLESKFGALPKRASGQRPTAFLTVQEGCDKFCTYCVVPYTRGAETRRPFADLIAEARALVAGGAREITLLGQNVNAWAGEAGRGGTGIDGDRTCVVSGKGVSVRVATAGRCLFKNSRA